MTRTRRWSIYGFAAVAGAFIGAALSAAGVTL